jgi:hypothetical protein
VQQVNRPHGVAFSKITNGVIRDMKIWKVRRPHINLFPRVSPLILIFFYHQPIGWNFATSGSVNLHAFNNKIVAVSDTNVSVFNFY